MRLAGASLAVLGLGVAVAAQDDAVGIRVEVEVWRAQNLDDPGVDDDERGIDFARGPLRRSLYQAIRLATEGREGARQLHRKFELARAIALRGRQRLLGLGLR